MAGYEERGVSNLEENVKGLNIEDRGMKRDEKVGSGMLGFIKHMGKEIGEAFNLGKPDADVTGFHLSSINTKRADVVIDVLITNPLPLPLPLLNMIYNVESDGRNLCSGTIPEAGTVQAHGSKTIKIPLTIIYNDILDTYKDIKPGQVIPYLVKVALVVDVPYFGKLTLPLKKEGQMPIPQKPDVDLEKMVWDHLSLDQTAATLHFNIKNMNKFDIGIKSLDYDLSIANVSIGKASLTQASTVKGNDSGKLQLPITFRPKDFGGALWDMIRGKGTGYAMIGSLEVGTPFGPMHLPFDKSSRTTLKGKDAEDV